MAANKHTLQACTDSPSFSLVSRQLGFTLLEALISLLIVALGLLGLAGLQARIQQAEFDSYQRAQAVVLLYDIVDRINVNRRAAVCFRITSNPATDFIGQGGIALPVCGLYDPETNAMANAALDEWNNQLLGAAEKDSSASNVGAMVKARGCISYGGTGTEIDGPSGKLAGTGIYTVAVSWEGPVDTVTPAANCANTTYNGTATDEPRRRTISTTFRLANLN